jgi:cardiolipin synthase
VIRRLLPLLLLPALLSGCGHDVVTAQLPTLPTGSGDVVLIEPDEGYGALYSWLAAPRSSLDMTMYELVDPVAERILAADAARGVRVRVLLDQQLERRANTPAYGFLRSHGVAVAWASDRYAATHQKTFVIDRRDAVVMSLNLTSRYYPTTRDVAVLDRSPADVAAIEQVFGADFAGHGVGTPAAADLVWSPRQSSADLLSLIAGARQSIWVESEELSDPPMIAALVAAARRGVAVHVAMTYQKDWAAGFDAVVRAGGSVRYFQGEKPLYIHAKIIAADPGTAAARSFVGSENLSAASLLHDRELGIVLVGAAAEPLAGVVEQDCTAGRTWRL